MILSTQFSFSSFRKFFSLKEKNSTIFLRNHQKMEKFLHSLLKIPLQIFASSIPFKLKNVRNFQQNFTLCGVTTNYFKERNELLCYKLFTQICKALHVFKCKSEDFSAVLTFSCCANNFIGLYDLLISLKR